MKKIFYGSIVLALSLGLNLYAKAVALEEAPGECPSMEIPFLTNISTHTIMEGTATILESWDSDKYMFTPGSDGLVKLTYKADVPISVKIDYECGGSGIYRKADETALKENSVEIPVTADQSIHIGTWDWESADGYPYSLDVEFIPANDDTNGTDNNNSSQGGSEDTNDTAGGNEDNIDDVIVYEDAQDGNIEGWVNISPYTGTIKNIETSNSRAIELTGTTNGSKNRASYSFGENWNNDQNFIAQWDVESDTAYEIFFIAQSDDDPNIVNYIGYVNRMPRLSDYTFNPSTGYWIENSTAEVMYDWGRYVYILLDDTSTMKTITRDLKDDAATQLGIDLNSIDSMWINIYGDSSKKVVLDNIILKRALTQEQNHPPVAIDQNISVQEGNSVSFTLGASDEDGDDLTYEIVDEPNFGTLDGEMPNLTYTADEVDQNSTDQIRFKVKDDENQSNIATININIIDIPQPQNLAPTANDINTSVDQNDSVSIQLTGTDPEGSALNYYIVQEPLYGTLSQTAPNLIYTPNSDYTGIDTFSYKVGDGDLNSSLALVAITVNEVSNEQNTTRPETINIDENTSIESNCAGQIIDTPEINRSVKIEGKLSGVWDSDRFSFVLHEAEVRDLEVSAKDSNGNDLKTEVIENCFTHLSKSDGKYSTSYGECELVTIVVYGCTDGEDVDYTLTLKILN